MADCSQARAGRKYLCSGSGRKLVRPPPATSSRKPRRWPAPRVATRPNVRVTPLLSDELLHAFEGLRPELSGSGGHVSCRHPRRYRYRSCPSLRQVQRPLPTMQSATPRVVRQRSGGARSREVVKPAAPARIASVNCRVMSSRSSGVASSSNARSPIAHVRKAEWPILAAKLMPLAKRSTASRYSGKVSKLHSIPSASAVGSMSSARSRLRTTSRALVGAHGGQCEPAIAHDGRRHSLPTRAGPGRIPEHLCVQVGVAVDESRCHSVTLGVDLIGAALGNPADEGDAVAETPTSPRKEPSPDPSTIVPFRITTS